MIHSRYDFTFSPAYPFSAAINIDFASIYGIVFNDRIISAEGVDHISPNGPDVNGDRAAGVLYDRGFHDLCPRDRRVITDPSGHSDTPLPRFPLDPVGHLRVDVPFIDTEHQGNSEMAGQVHDALNIVKTGTGRFRHRDHKIGPGDGSDDGAPDAGRTVGDQ